MKLTSCAVAPGLVLLLSGCSLLFTPAQNSSEDAGTDVEVDANPATLDAGGDTDLSRAVHTIGEEQGDFASFNAWKDARSGDLGNRQELLVAVGGTLPNAGAELTGDLGCAGTYRPQKQYGERVTIDLADFTPECQVGEQLSVSGSGVAVGSVTQAGPRGIIEIVRLHHRNYRAPIVIDSFVGTDPLHYLVVEANPADPHQGIAGQGVTIRYVEVPSGMASHGVEIHVDYTQLRGFEITDWANGAAEDASLEGVRVEANHVLLDRLLIHDDGADLINADSDGIFSSMNEIELTVRNSFIYNVARAGIHFQNNSESTLRVQNCTLHNCVANDSHVGITYGCVATSNADVIVEAINTLGFAQLDSDTARAPAFSLSPSSEFAETSGNNATDDDSHPGEDGHLVGSGADLLEQALGLENDDLHLKQTFSIQPPYNGGRVLPDFDVDIDGEARGATWSIGADQVQF